MSKDKGLIGGTEQGEGKIYPPDWLCLCNHDKRSHFRGEYPVRCYALEVCECPDDGLEVCGCNCYRPLDNLTLIERLARG